MRQGRKLPRETKWKLTPQPPQISERTAAKSSEGIGRLYVRELNTNLVELFEREAIWRADSEDSDDDVEEVSTKVLASVVGAGAAWAIWGRGMSRAHARMGAKMESDLVRLGVPAGVTPPSAPELLNGIDAQKGRLEAILEKRAGSVAGWLTRGRTASTPAEALDVLLALERAGLSPKTLAKFVDSLSAGIREVMAGQLGNILKPKVPGIITEIRNTAIDQVLTTNAEVSASKMMAIGVEDYEWVTKRDDKVRRNHKRLDGRVFKYGDPPRGGGTGPADKGPPGSGYGCRCGAFPIL